MILLYDAILLRDLHECSQRKLRVTRLRLDLPHQPVKLNKLKVVKFTGGEFVVKFNHGVPGAVADADHDDGEGEL